MAQKGLLGLLAVCTIALAAGAAYGQNYPVKPVRVLTADPAGGVDFTARVVSQGLADLWKQSVVVENRGGGGGMIAGETLARANPDGYTLMVYSSSIWLLPFLGSQVRYDPMKDFAHLSLLTTAPNILVVYPALPVNSVKDLIALAKSKPGELNYAEGATGASNHLAAELFLAMTATKIVHIPYKGATPAYNDLVSGRVHLMFAFASSVSSLVKSGRLKALAVTSAKRTELAPGLPTVAETLPGYESGTEIAAFAPVKTDAKLVTRLNADIVKVLNQPEIKQKFFVAGADVVGSTPAELSASIKANMARWGKVIKDAGIRAN